MIFPEFSDNTGMGIETRLPDLSELSLSDILHAEGELAEALTDASAIIDFSQGDIITCDNSGFAYDENLTAFARDDEGIRDANPNRYEDGMLDPQLLPYDAAADMPEEGEMLWLTGGLTDQDTRLGAIAEENADNDEHI
jgi:hypothetical protein